MYAITVPNKDARFINYCEMQCSFKWTRGDFVGALEWGRRGKELKDRSNVDTSYDVGHVLALAERDAGRPEEALAYFLHSRTIAEVTDPEDLDEDRGGPFYGNIGRCLHFMGKTDEALICYQKSAILIEKDPKSEFVLNQGYIRAWIGELLLSHKQTKLGWIFLRAAYRKWEQVSPPKARKVTQMLKYVEVNDDSITKLSNDAIEKTCLDWIMGHNLDAKFC